MSAGGREGADLANVSITGLRSELSGIVVQQPVPAAATGMHINLFGQQANALLHDVHAWKDLRALRGPGLGAR